MTKPASDWIDGTAKTQVKRFYATLSEKDQRRFAALEAQRLGHGGIKYIAELLGCSTKTISRGIHELNTLDDDPAAGRMRRPGAGRKKSITPGSAIEQNLNSLTETRTAGDPDDPEIVFTDLTPTQLEQELQALGTPAGDDVIRRWMDEQNLRLRKFTNQERAENPLIETPSLSTSPN